MSVHSEPITFGTVAPVQPDPAVMLPVRQAVKRHFNREGCRTSEYMPPGSKKVGLSKDNQPSKVVVELRYGMTETAYKALSARFPGVAFVMVGTDSHDHPIAHASRRVVWDNLVGKIRPGSKVADLYGDPNYNERFNKSQARRREAVEIDTFVKVTTARDAVRAVRWGPELIGTRKRFEEMSLYDMYRNETNSTRFAKYDVFLMNHSLYYFSFAEINRLVNLRPGSVLYATIHRHGAQSGTLHNGEQTWTKDPHGIVTQVNVVTGESYTHGDTEKWFSKFQYADSHGGMAWTINQGAPEHFVVMITACKSELVEPAFWLDGCVISRHKDEVSIIQVPVPAPPSYEAEVVEIDCSSVLDNKLSLGVPRLPVRVTITHPDLFKKLQHFMIMKPRRPEVLKDLVSKAHRECGHSTLFSGDKKVVISPKALSEHIMAAFLGNVSTEKTLLLALSSDGAKNLNRALRGNVFAGNSWQSTLRSAIKASLIVKSVQGGRDPVVDTLSVLDEWF